MIQLVIMKKYNLFFGLCAVISAVMFSSCEENKGTRTMVYTEHPPQLTVMTQTTTTPADTYSEYMATYTTAETGTTNFFVRPVMEGVAADTAVGNNAAAVTTAPVTDTAAAPPRTETASPPEAFAEITETISAAEESSEDGETIASDNGEPASGTTVVSKVTNIVPQLPAPDTAVPNAVPNAVQADTAHSRYSETSGDSGTDTNNSNGGTDNAD